MPANLLLRLIACLALTGCPLIAAAATEVWIDTDPAIGSPIREIDDGFALICAFRSPELRIAGISTTYGNASIKTTTATAEKLVREFGKTAELRTRAVNSGADSARDLGRATKATEALASALSRKRLTYIALGPLTNLATFIRCYPALVGRIDRVIFLGGKIDGQAIVVGQNRALQIHDANVFKDPAAARIVINSKIPLTLVPITTAARLTVDANDMRHLRASGPAGNYLYATSRLWLWFWTRIARSDGGPIFDALAVIAAARPQMLQSDAREAVVDMRGELIRREIAGERLRIVRWCRGFDSEAKNFLLSRLAQRAKRSPAAATDR